ncbi:putative solute carrier family 13 [Helianthus annuus]|nr:putative solute carrier family 13 [Helianthus annuus]
MAVVRHLPHHHCRAYAEAFTCWCMGLVCLMITMMTKTLMVKDALSGFTKDIIWLIVVSFFFSRGFVKTGLGDRFAMYFVKWFGKSTLGLAYGFAIGEAIILPAISAIARWNILAHYQFLGHRQWE